jgi:hypothetical protein
MKLKSPWFLLLALLSLSTVTQAAERLRVLNQALAPIAGAEVMIGSAANNPFGGNVLITDANGYISIPIQWKAALPVSVKAPGYIMTRFEKVQPQSAVFQIHQLDPAALIEVSGETTSFQNIKKDGLIDFGLVFPTMSRRQLMQFSVTDLVSPETDEVRVATQKFDLPSNVTLPEQKETYILPITLKKPKFRAYVKPDSKYTMTAAHGQFPMKQVISEMQNGASFFDVMNYFTFMNFGQLDLTVEKSTIPGQMIPVNQNVIDSKVSYQAPAFNNDQVLLAAPLVEQNGTFYPTDLKRLTSNELRDLTVPAQAKSIYVVSVLTAKEQAAALNAQLTDMLLAETQPVAAFFQSITSELYSFMGLQEDVTAPGTMPGITLSISKAPVLTATEFISLTQPPTVAGTRLKLTVPTAPSSVAPVATYVIFSEVEKIVKGRFTIEKRTRHLEFFAESWIDGLDIPDLSSIIVPGKTYRWEVMYLGRDNNTKAGNYFLDEITHVSRHSYDF